MTVHWLADFVWSIVGINVFIIVCATIRYFRSEPEPETLERHLEDLEQQAHLSRLNRVA